MLLSLGWAGVAARPASADCSASASSPSPGPPALGFSATVAKRSGAEPNIAVSPSGKNIMVSGLGPTSPALLLRSTDYGATYRVITPSFANSGGGDWDMRWIDDTHIIAADLSIGTGIYIHRSSDAGDHWSDATIPFEVYDRPWIDHFGANDIYVVAKGFDGVPYLYASTDGGQSFLPRLPLLVYGLTPIEGGPDVASAFTTSDNAYVDHLLVDGKRGDVYVLYGIGTPPTVSPSQPQGTPNQLYVAHLEGNNMVSHPVQLGKADESCLGGFNWLTEDQAGTLFVLGNCRIDGRWSTFLSYSRDKARHWSPLVDLGEAGNSNVYASIAGADPGKLAMVYLRGSNTSPGTAQDWYARTATVTAADTSAPQVQRNSPLVGPIHTRDICFDGILCGLLPTAGSDRNLLDYIWNAVGPDGRAYAVLASDGPATGSASGRTPDVVILRQVSGPTVGRGVQS
jgi:hypothetical protein